MRSAGCYAAAPTGSPPKLSPGSPPAAGDPDGEVAVAWWAAQQLCLAYAIGDLTAARTHAAELIDTLLDCPVPEVARLGRTLATAERAAARHDSRTRSAHSTAARANPNGVAWSARPSLMTAAT
jgi:hypothetical protein